MMEKNRIKIPEASRAHWEKIGIKKRIGTAVPLFSLRGRYDYGIGDLGSLREYIDFCTHLNLEIIQLLPINETSPHDNSPFGAVSAFAINPLFVDADRLFKQFELGDPQQQINKDAVIRQLAQEVKQRNRADYHLARTIKTFLLKYVYDKFRTDNKKYRDLKEDFIQFYTSNAYWLKCYSLFKLLKEKEEWRAIYDWPQEWQIYSEQFYCDVYKSNDYDMDFFVFVQWVLFNQALSVKVYAATKGILLKGDIPLLVSSQSADAWQYPQYFDQELDAGAPPDFYSEDGQDWGLPIYNWEALKKDNYVWWRNRLKYAENFFDIYRIDHVLGLFRIWAVPKGKKAIKGSYQPKDKTQWEEHGEGLLRMMLESTTMLPIAEDLGDVPPMVRVVLDRLGIPGHKLLFLDQWWPPNVFSPVSMLTTSTHDSGTFYGVWDSRKPKERTDFCFQAGLVPPPDLIFDNAFHLRLMNKIIISTPSLFVILPFQDFLGKIIGLIGDDPEQERVNTPATVGDHNWSYRLPDINNSAVTSKLSQIAEIILKSKEVTKYRTSPFNPQEVIQYEVLKNKKSHSTDIQKDLKIMTPYPGMARIIIPTSHGSHVVTDISMFPGEGSRYEAVLPAPHTSGQIKVTFLWRMGPDTYKWEGEDFTIDYCYSS